MSKQNRSHNQNNHNQQQIHQQHQTQYQQQQQQQQLQQQQQQQLQQQLQQQQRQSRAVVDYEEEESNGGRRRRRGGRTNVASCIVATIFLIFILIIILIVFFTVFKPKDPLISVNSVTLPSFSLTNNSVTFTFSQYLSVNNPNRDDFSHYDSSLQLLYSGSQIGFMFIPAGTIGAGRTTFMAATFAVNSFPLSSSPDPNPNYYSSGSGRVGPMMELESRVQIVGRVRVFHFFTHHVEVNSACRLSVSLSDASVFAFHC